LSVTTLGPGYPGGKGTQTVSTYVSERGAAYL